MFNVFMWILFLLVFGAIIGFAYLLFRIIREQREIDAQYKDIDEEEKLKQKKLKNKVTIADKLNNSSFESVLEEVKNNPDDLEELKQGIQDILRKSMKSGDTSKARICNEQLRKIDTIQKEGK